MTPRRTLLKSATAALALTVFGPLAANADEPLPVVATFSILGDMVARVGGEHVAVTTLVGAGGDTHVYRPTPADARAVAEAELLFVNGLEFEGWLDRLVDAAGFDGVRVVATDGIEAIAYGDDHDDHDENHAEDKHDHEEHAEDDHDHEHEDHAEDDHDHEHEDHAEGDHDHEHEEHAEDAHHDDHDDHDDAHGHHDHGAFDPHAWQSLGAAVTYVDNIAAALAKAHPAHASDFYQNRATYVAEIEALDAEISALISTLPDDKRTVVTSHDAFQYFGEDYGLTFLAPQGISTESEASAQDVARLIEQIREEGISAVFVENVADSRLIEQIANETGASVGGTLYPGALSDADGPAPTYLDMMRHNATTLAEALGS